MSLDDVPVCRMCLEPVFYSICPHCLFEDLNRWMENEAPFVAREIEDAHTSLIATFPDVPNNHQVCVRCNRDRQDVMCPYCYVREVYHQVRMVDATVAERLITTFDFDFEGNGYFGEIPWNPVEFHEIRIDGGICESCENEKETLYGWQGSFQCSDCLDDRDGFRTELEKRGTSEVVQ